MQLWMSTHSVTDMEKWNRTDGKSENTYARCTYAQFNQSGQLFKSCCHIYIYMEVPSVL